MPDLAGQTLLNRYRVDAFVGQGGMAEVYKAWDAKRAAFVALKLLKEDLAEDHVFLRRFAREARALEVLEHPHIVRFFGFEQTHGLAFLVTEFIEGLTLRRYLRDLGRPLTLPEALYVVRPVCSALHYAHQTGIYHCDVKPANIFIERGGRVVMADFGVARLTESATVTFSAPGTPAYMSPEQCREEELNASTDIYSLGVTTYEMLTLDRPFKGETEETTGSRVERVRWEQMYLPPPSPRKINSAISPVAEAAILKALEKEPGRRQRGVLEFYEELSGAQAVQSASSLPGIEGLVGSALPQSLPTSPSTPQEGVVGIGGRLPMGIGVVVGGIGAVLLAVWLLILINSSSNGRGDEVATLAAQLTVDAVAALAQPATRLPTDTPTPLSPTPSTQTWTPPMPSRTSTPTPLPPADTPAPATAGASSCPGAPRQLVRVGERAWVCTKYDQLIVRAQPRRSSNELTRLNPGTYISVVDGPVCADTWSWWRIRTDFGMVGWVAEGGDEIDPYFICPAR
jgi:serine/threonine protein kinase